MAAKHPITAAMRLLGAVFTLLAAVSEAQPQRNATSPVTDPAEGAPTLLLCYVFLAYQILRNYSLDQLIDLN